MGTRIPFRRFRVLLQDHPHACGDKLSDEFVLLNDLGSSPRVWGQVTRYLHMLKDSGIIPTRVGTRKALDFAGVNYEDHPHACGDKSAYPSIMLQYKGSSPRVWGQVTRYLHMLKDSGIIPTRVGTRRFARNWSERVEDHPHACGDKR